MTPADLLRKQAAELWAAADALDAGASIARPAHDDDKLLDTRKAMRISGCSSSWLYANARRYGFGFQLPTRAWRFYDGRLRDFCAGRVSEREEKEKREVSEAARLSHAQG